MPIVSRTSCKITFLGENTAEEARKIVALIDSANEMIMGYFGIRSTYDIIICKGNWEMEVQVLSREKSAGRSSDRLAGITDYRLKEIVIRSDKARFAHYLHELIHGIIAKSHPHQLREALAWYFTLKLLEPYRYLRPRYPAQIDSLYVAPARKLAALVGDDFLKDFAVGRGSLDATDKFPDDVRALFLPEEAFYAKETE